MEKKLEEVVRAFVVYQKDNIQMFFNNKDDRNVSDQVQKLLQSVEYLTRGSVVFSTKNKPKNSLILIMTLMLGIMVGVVIVFIREATRKTFRTADEVEKKVGLDILSIIKSSQGLSRKTNRTDDDKKESLRVLRTNLLHKLARADNNKVMICTPVEEDFSEFVTELAKLLAAAKRKVLLIDGDLKKGSLYKNINGDGQNGLTSLLTNAEKKTVIQIDEYLDVISGNDYSEKSSELLMSDTFNREIESFSSEYEIVLIAASPILSSTDATLIASKCGLNILLINSHKTTIESSQLATKRLRQGGVIVNSCIFNITK